MNNSSIIDIANILTPNSKKALKQAFEISQKLNLEKVDEKVFLHALKNDPQVSAIINELKYQPPPLLPKKTNTSLRIKFSNSVKKAIIFSYQELLLFSDQSIEPYHLFLALQPHLNNSFSLDQARQITSRITKKSVKKTALSQFTSSLTQGIEAKSTYPIVGRDQEIEQLIRILGRKTKSSAVLVGEPGVGKSAIVVGLAQKINHQQVPSLLKNIQILSLNLTSLVAGASLRGDLEGRLNQLVESIRANGNIILFIDEIHMIADQRATGAMSIANILKPALSKGEISIIGATTPAEYRQHIEKDPALSRRFEAIKINEPSKETSLKIVQTVADSLSQQYQIKISDEAVKASVEFSSRYIQDRHLPGKAIDLLDESASATQLTNKKILDEPQVRQVLSQKTGIPLTQLSKKEEIQLLNLENEVKKYIVGQDPAIDSIASVIKRARAGLKDPNRPIGSFLLLGPTGVGKTELAKTLARIVYQDKKSLIRLDMSEYSERHTAQRLLGSPPGYVGYEEGGQLTNPIKQRPYSLILLDEIEKAHPKLFDIFLQVLDDGRLTDSQGNLVDFKNTVIIMTSNIDVSGFLNNQTAKKNRTQLMQVLGQHFRPEFLNRIDDIVLMNSLGKAELKIIAQKLIDQLNQKLSPKNISVAIAPEALDKIISHADTKHFGARPLKRLIQTQVEEPLAEKILSNQVKTGQKVIFKPEDIS